MHVVTSIVLTRIQLLVALNPYTKRSFDIGPESARKNLGHKFCLAVDAAALAAFQTPGLGSN